MVFVTLLLVHISTKDGTTLSSQEFANLAMLGGFTGQLPEPENKKKISTLENNYSQYSFLKISIM